MSVPLGDAGIVIGAGRSERAIAIDTVREFMDAMARHDLDAARARLAPGFLLTVPGGQVFRSLEDFLAFGAGRYRAIRKYTDDLEACEAPVGFAVYARGTMAGTWVDGTAFEQVRYIDRMLVREGRIAEMQVWNDIGESRPGRATAPAHRDRTGDLP